MNHIMRGLPDLVYALAIGIIIYAIFTGLMFALKEERHILKGFV